ncbi:MAG: AMP-binding protein [Gammaproteobacteria bacterium]
MNTLSKQDIQQELIAITAKLLADSGEARRREIKLDASLQRHLGIDSLGRSELFHRVEKSFDVTIPDRLLAQAESLQDIADYLEHASPGIKQATLHEVMFTHGEKANVDPAPAQTLIDILLMYAQAVPNKVHIYFQHEDGQEEPITYQQLLTASLCVARALRELGLNDGETVAIMLPTHPGFFYTFYGVLLAGGIPVPIYPPFRMHMLEAYAKTEAHILSNAEVRLLVTFDEAEKLGHLLQGFVPSLKKVTTMQELMKNKQSLALDAIFKPASETPAFIQYTSGSTSDPKGVLLSHYNLLSNIRAYGKAIEVTPDDVCVSWLPLYHDMGLIGAWLGSLYHGIPLVLLTPFTFLNHPERWLWAIHYHRGTVSAAPNFAYDLCVRKIDPGVIEGLDLSSWRLAANGAEKVYPRTLELFIEKFSPYGLKSTAPMPVYGLAESTVGLAIPPMNRKYRVDHIDRKEFEESSRAVMTADKKNTLTFLSCGFPLAGHEIRITDENNLLLSERQVGRLQFRGPSSMQGYYNNPTATEAICHDGWLDSGDLAYQADGEVFITGRRKDLIIKAGRNLYPVEIEELVGAVPGIRQGCVAAFGVTDAKRGTEQLVVVAETKETNREKRQQIIEAINDTISTVLDMVPDHIELVAPRTVPKTSSGKLQRSACKKMYIDGKLSRFHLPPWMQVAKLGAGWGVNKSIRAVKKIGRFFYTCYMGLAAVLTVLPLWAAVSFVSQPTAAKLCRRWARLMLTLSFCPMKYAGLENLTRISPVIFAANHASYIDAIMMIAILPTNTRLIGKKEIFAVPIIGSISSKLKYISVDRLDLTKGIEDTKQIAEAIKAGDSVMIFPEGTFGYASGLRPFRLGTFKAAAETNTAICPIALSGNRFILRSGEGLMKPGRISVVVSSPIKPVGTEWTDVVALRDLVRADIIKHCGEPSLDLIVPQTVASSIAPKEYQ